MIHVIHLPVSDASLLSLLSQLQWENNTVTMVGSAGLDTSITASKFDGAPDLQRALSLLSAGSCGFPDPVQQASCLIQFSGTSENNGDLHSSHGGSSAPVSCADEQHIAPQSQLVRFTMDAGSNSYDSNFFGLNQIN